MMFIKSLLSILLFIDKSESVPDRKLQLVGSNHDQHGCVTDGGYQWCESTQSCIRPWITRCSDTSVITNTHSTGTTEFCTNSPQQLCRMMCPTVNCLDNQCAMRTGNCCDYTCVSAGPTIARPAPTPQLQTNSPPSNCISWYDGCNTCQVVNGRLGACTMMMCFTQGTPECRAYTSGHRRLSEFNDNIEYLRENQICSRFRIGTNYKKCLPGLECINVMGNMIADAPGKCKKLCNINSSTRDFYGNCIENGCRKWYDGCNICLVSETGKLGCSRKFCRNGETPKCLSNVNNMITSPQIDNSKKSLKKYEICYRFCENNSNFINKKNLCPTDTVCKQVDNNVIGFDSCNNAYRCIPINHH